MRQTIERTWELLENTVNELSKNTSGIVLDKKLYKDYDLNFRNMYNEIKERYMEDDVKNLDRHKVASIIIVSILKTEAIKYEGKMDQNTKFFGKYLIAASVGFNFMQNQLNAQLIEKNQKPINAYWFPHALSCDTPYFEILCRNLYYSDNNDEWKLNPLDIAEKLFLLEYITLEKNGIDPYILKCNS